MQKCEIDGLPESDRVFLLESGDYVRSRFRLKDAEQCCASCGYTSIGEEVPHLVVFIEMATCDEGGCVLKDAQGRPVHAKRHAVSVPKGMAGTMTQSELFALAKEKALPLMEAEIKIRRGFQPIAPDLDEPLF